MKQHEAVIKVLEENGGYATLNHLYHHVPLISDCTWKTKTPQASIRRIVQENERIFKIRPGLWALEDWRQEVLRKLGLVSADQKKEVDFTHSYYQGLLVELGNLGKYDTYVPPQDQNKLFLETPLKNLVTTSKIYPFTYDSVLGNATTIDVIWFNSRRFPHAFFEVEHSTDMQNSLVKFVELQDFFVHFYMVSGGSRKREFESKIVKSAFTAVSDRVRFLDYEYVSNWHAKAHALLHATGGDGV